MARAVFHSGGTVSAVSCECGEAQLSLDAVVYPQEGMESAIKLARQFHVENGQPQRINYIARDQSYHGNSLGCE
jgi:adenosylmethionine-8-amino-7-oxononanoate aminotransferase